MTLLIGILIWCFCALPIHELGHFVAAKRLGLKNIRLELWRWRGIPLGVQITGDSPTYDFEKVEDVVKFHVQANFMQLMGGVFSIVGLLIFVELDLLPLAFAPFLMALESLYMVWEATNPRNIARYDNE